MKNGRSEGCVLQLSSVLALLQWHMVQSNILNEEYKRPAPYAQSPNYLKYLANQDRKIYNAIKVYEDELQERLDLVKKYVKDYESSTVAGTSHLDSEDERVKMVVQHPLLAFRMLSRFAKEFDAIVRHISARAEEVLSEVVSEAKDYRILPIQSDVEDAVDAMLHMQFMYDLPSALIANGQVPGGENIPVNLTTEQCYYIAKHAQTTLYHTLALEWFDETKQRIKDDPKKDNYGITESSLDENFLAVIGEHNILYDGKFEDGHGSLYTEIVESVVPPRPSTMRHDVVSRYSTTEAIKSHLKYAEIMYARKIALCNGENIGTPKDESKLKCWLDHRKNPYWRILPLKIELLNDSPQVIQIHDFISDSWISILKKAVYADLREVSPTDDVVSQTAGFSWHSDEEIAEAPLSRKIELATGLNVRGQRCSSHLQVAAYALYGYMAVHSDATGPEFLEGEKEHHSVFTFLIYLNDVEMGGLTSFPRLGFFVKPEKGSAILFNTKEEDELMLHESCPMIYGEKWIATKFVSGIENMFTQPCDLKVYA